MLQRRPKQSNDNRDGPSNKQTGHAKREAEPEARRHGLEKVVKASQRHPRQRPRRPFPDVRRSAINHRYRPRPGPRQQRTKRRGPPIGGLAIAPDRESHSARGSLIGRTDRCTIWYNQGTAGRDARITWRSAMETYRAIVIFESDSLDDATSKASKAARSAKGTLDRLTVRRE